MDETKPKPEETQEPDFIGKIINSFNTLYKIEDSPFAKQETKFFVWLGLFFFYLSAFSMVAMTISSIKKSNDMQSLYYFMEINNIELPKQEYGEGIIDYEKHGIEPIIVRLEEEGEIEPRQQQANSMFNVTFDTVKWIFIITSSLICDYLSINMIYDFRHKIQLG